MTTTPPLLGSDVTPLTELEAQAVTLTNTPRVMLDSAKPSLIPVSAPMVAGYVDGSYEWYPEDWQRFDGKPKAHITVEPYDRNHKPTGFYSGNWQKASVIDVETGAFSVADAARFLPARNTFREDTATAYCNESRLDTLLRACRGLLEPYWLWLAWYIGHIPTPVDVAAILARLQPFGVKLAAWQYQSGPRYDTSEVYAPGWHAS